MMISVCMATYNGEKFITEQLNSILSQLKENDEVIIVDDCSIDDTVKIIKELNDFRIKLFINEQNKGHNASFERAILNSEGDYIFIADQDDIWVEGRIDSMINRLQSKMFCAGNPEFIFEEGCVFNDKYPLLKLKKSEENKKLVNTSRILVGISGYFGCCSAFRRDFIKYILPFPKSLESYDLWMAQNAILMNEISHIDDIVLFRRIHDNNVSYWSRNIYKILKSRMIFIKLLFVSVFRIIKIKKGDKNK